MVAGSTPAHPALTLPELSLPFYCAETFSGSEKVSPHAFPSFVRTKPIPRFSSAARIAFRLFGIGARRPASKSFTVERPTVAAFARSSCEISSHARAARHCSGVIP